jgi:hypothetical protein
MIVKEAFRVAVATKREKYSLTEFGRRCTSIREFVRHILGPLRIGDRQVEDLVLENERFWLIFSIKCSGQLPLALELERDFSARAILDCEIAAAKSLCEQYFRVLRELFVQAAITGMELEEFQEQLPEMDKFQKAFKVVDGRRQVVFKMPELDPTEFTLSPLPGRIVGEKVIAIRFRVYLVGTTEAQIGLAHQSRIALRSLRRQVRLLWEASAGDRTISTTLFAAAHTRTILEGKARAVYKSNGKLSDVLLESLGKERLSFSKAKLSSDQLKEAVAAA